MLKKLISMLNNVSDEILQNQYLAEDNFPFLVKAPYPKIIQEFKERFVFIKKVEYEGNHQNNIFTEPTSQIDLQVLDYVVPDYAIEFLRNCNEILSKTTILSL